MTDKLTIHLTVSAAAGAPRVPIEVTPEVTGAELRRQAVEATKIPDSALKLIFRGRMIAKDDKKAVSEYKFEDGSVLHCMGKPVEENAASSAPSAAASATTSDAAAPTAAPAAAAALPSVNLMPPAAAAPAAGGGDPLTTALRTLRASNAPPVYKTAVETLEKLLAKIIENPMEAKYRRVKKENAAFTRRLGGLPGGDAAMKAAGFNVETDETGQPVYQMQASAEAWPKLLAAQTAIRTAVQEAQAASAAPAAPPAMPGFPSMNPGAGAAGMSSEGMQQAAANLMSNPQAMQSMLNNPMVQNMMRNDPRFANNPMAQQMIQSLASNPEMLQQASQMMSDPNVRQRMQQMQQNPEMMQQMAQQMQDMSGNMPQGGTGGTQPSSTSQQQQQPQNDEDMTEEEMIAEAIRRSLQDNGNNNN